LAWESATTQNGLLTFALVRKGLEERKADFLPTDGKIGLQEWLRYGLQEVPQLYGVLQASAKERLVTFDSRDRNTHPYQRETEVMQVQRPILFSFKRGEDVIISDK
jgi:hypothetical protein